MRRQLRRTAVLVLSPTLGAIVAVGLAGPGGAPAAGAQTAPPPLSSAPNPWVLTETNPAAEGLRINAAAGANGQPFIVYDYLGQPIFAVNRAGGAAVLGDDFRVLDGADVFNGQITLSPTSPVLAVCVRSGQLWVGGSTGRVWRCSGSPLAWRTVL